jgi:hypothetical protein
MLKGRETKKRMTRPWSEFKQKVEFGEILLGYREPDISRPQYGHGSIDRAVVMYVDKEFQWLWSLVKKVRQEGAESGDPWGKKKDLVESMRYDTEWLGFLRECCIQRCTHTHEINERRGGLSAVEAVEHALWMKNALLYLQCEREEIKMGLPWEEE